MAQLRGVNLGGWFVLEQWMRPFLFEGISGPDETVFSIENKKAAEVLHAHWDNFIKQDDIIDLVRLGINSVRLPLPWWLLGEKPYIERLSVVDRVIGWLEKHRLPYLLDLHTAPGCQNGFDNGGITGVIDWPKSDKNIDLTIEKLVYMTERYGKNPHFLGIEVLNEPHSSIDLAIIQDFYIRSYKALRPLTSGLIVFHDAFRPNDPSWKPFFSENHFDNVAFDLHLYYCFAPHYAAYSLNELVAAVLGETDANIRSINEFVPVIIGEWSLGLDEKRFHDMDDFQNDTYLRAFANAQLASYEQVFGWFFWSYRIDRPSHRAWDFSRLVTDGIFPTSFHHKEKAK